MSRCCRRREFPNNTATLINGVASKNIITNLRDISFISVVVLIMLQANFSLANPVPSINNEPIDPSTLPEFNQSSSTVQSLLNNNASNSTTNDLYVIRAVVYEIGILTDVDNSTDETTEKHEEVNISFYDPPHKENGLLDLSGIPVPQVVAPTNYNSNN